MAIERIGRYIIKGEIGRGGMATVYHAYDPHFERDVAIKVLPHELMHDLTFRARFEREAKTVAALNHPAIVPIYDFGEEEQPFLVMRLMAGGSLSDRIKTTIIPLDLTIAILDRIGGALDAAHSQEIVHRDVKPGNILFDDKDEAYLSDFGIVKLTEATTQLTGSGAAIGTPAYMAPEIADRGGVSSLTDIYALGVTLFQMLAGEVPYEGDTPMGTLMAHALKPIPDIREYRPDLPDGVQRVIECVLAKDPRDRYPTAFDFVADLRAAITTEAVEEADMATPEPAPPEAPTMDVAHISPVPPPISAPQPRVAEAAPPAAVPRPTPRRMPLLPIVGGIGGLIIVGVVVAVLLGGSRDGPAAAADLPTFTPAASEAIAEEAAAPIDVPIATQTPAPTDTVAPEATSTMPPTETPTPAPTETPGPTNTPTVAAATNIRVYDCMPDGNAEICLSNADGSGEVNLTNHWARDEGSLLLPGGAQIMFTSNRAGAPGIYIMNIDGSDATFVREGNVSGVLPDGRILVGGICADGVEGMCMMNVDGSGLTGHFGPVGITGGTPSPDGQWVAYMTGGEGGGPRYLNVVRTDGSDQAQLTTGNSPGSAMRYSWSPDSTRISFASDTNGDGNIDSSCGINVDGSGLSCEPIQ